MRKLKVETWKALDKEKNEYDESILTILTVLINNKKPEEMPRGIDKFRLFTRIGKAFDESKESGELIFEESDYKFLKDMIEKDIPSVWGFNENILKAIDLFLDTKES